jgi:hypothetical protein
MKIIIKQGTGLSIFETEKPTVSFLEWSEEFQSKINDFVNPNINEDFTDIIETATIEDIAENNIQQALHNETQKYIQRTTDGVNAYAKISAEFRLAKLSGTIDDATHTYLENLLIPVRNEVLAGQWISAKQKLIVIGVAQVGEVLYNRLFDQITNYIEINY